MSADLDPANLRIWTILIYLAGDNNLSEECVYALTEAKQALSDTPDKLAVLAQFDPSGVRTETRRFLLRSKDKTLTEDGELTGWKARETDTGEPLNLLEFIRWGIAQFPAHYYMVILAGHGGTEVNQDFLLKDENPPNALNILELRYIFEQLEADRRMIHILGMDTCLMSMAELCFELNRASVQYLVSSEGFSPNTGWPYMQILKALRDQIREHPGDATPEWLAKRIVQEYNAFYEPYINGGIAVDQSALKVAQIDVVKKKMFSLCGALLDEIDRGELDYGRPKNNALVLAHWDAQSYNGELFVDLHDFCDRLIVRYGEAGDTEGEVVRLCKEVRAAIDYLVLKTCVAGAAFQFSYGISIYFPWAVVSSRYGNLAFPKDTRWLDFLRLYHEKTRRPSRRWGANDPFVEDMGPPFRASVPQNRGRSGNVESMRNPPIREFVECPAMVKTNGELQPAIDSSLTEREAPTNGAKTTRKRAPARAATAGGSYRGNKSNRRK